MTWEMVKLGEIATIVSGATPKTGVDEYWDGPIAWATPKDLSKLKAKNLDKTEYYITEKGYRSCSTVLLPARSVLLSSRAPIGYVAINSIPMATNQGFKSIIPKNGVLDSDYLYHWLRSQTSYLNSLGRGATFKEISKSIVEEIKVPLPPFSTQQRIAAVLDEVDALRQKREQSMEVLDLAWHAVAHSLLGDLLSNERGWPSTPLKDLGQITSGVTKGRKLRGTARAIPYMRVANVQDGYITLQEIKTIDATEEEIERFRLKPGDVLLTEGGDPDKLGRGAVWQGEFNECIFQNHIFRVRLNTEIILPEVASHIIGSEYGKKYFLRSAKQTTGIASINSTQLKAFPALVPDSATQYRFVEQASHFKIERDKLADSLEQFNVLFSSLQTHAFSGELALRDLEALL